MDFLKSAVASIAKGPAFPYSFGEKLDLDQSIWSLHNGTKREDGSKCSILCFDVNANRSRQQLAKNALRKFRTLRHPGVVKVLDTLETDQWIYIAIERVTPLAWFTKRKALGEEALRWGLHSVAKTIKFVNDEAVSVHGSIRTSSILVSAAGEWKLAGLDICSSMKEDDAVIFTQASLLPDMGRYTPPEAVKTGWETIRSGPIHAVDSYGFGILIAEVFSGSLSGLDGINNFKGIPQNMQTSYRRLIHAVPKMRLSVGHFLEQGCRHGAFFDTPLIKLTDGVENLGLKGETEREAFLSDLESVVASSDLPEDYMQVRILPELLKTVEFTVPATASTARSLHLAVQIASKLDEDTYTSQVTPVLIRLFGSPDRALRVALLDNIPHMIDHLSQKIVNDKLFPQIVTGFGDLAPVVREQSVKSILVIVNKLSDRVINGELLRHLAKTANDEQAGIRTNTTICLGKIARNLGASTRAKVLAAAFSRSLRDPFVHARNAALLALAATVDVFSDDDCASKMLPAICPSLIDREKMIRVQAEKTMSIYLDRIRKYAQTLPDTSSNVPSGATTRVSSPQPQAGAGGQLLGWAISSFTNTLSAASGEIQVNGTTPPPLIRSASTPGSNGSSTRPSAAAHLPSAPMVPRAPSNLRSSSTVDHDEEDFAAEWAEMDDEPTTESDAIDAWETAASETVSNSHVQASLDDGGKPDFEGWLSAQAAAKTRSTKPLPKGLAKKGAPVKSASTTNLPSKKPAVVVTKAAAPARQEVPPDDDDGWGDAWG